MEQKNYENLIKKYEHLISKDGRQPIVLFGIECGDGWYDLIEELIDHIDTYFKHKYKSVPDGFEIVQIKEKFGGLRFYIHGGDDAVYEIIRFAETFSYKTCEYCGSNQQIKQSTGWIITACKNCIETNELLKGKNWKDCG